MGTWWIDKPLLLGSSNPSDTDVEALYRDGFSILVSLLKEDEQPPRYDPENALALGYKRYNIPVRDFRTPSVGQFGEFIQLSPVKARRALCSRAAFSLRGALSYAICCLPQGNPPSQRSPSNPSSS